MSARTRVFIASSLDGFIAGPDDELDWLEAGDTIEDTYSPFFAGIGAMLIGRRTHDVVAGFGGAWPYGDTPILVATRSADFRPAHHTVTAVAGSIREMVEQARRTAAPRDVYIDGGDIIRQALDAGLVDDITLTLVPTVLGRGIPLFAGATDRHRLRLLNARDIGAGFVQLHYVPEPERPPDEGSREP